VVVPARWGGFAGGGLLQAGAGCGSQPFAGQGWARKFAGQGWAPQLDLLSACTSREQMISQQGKGPLGSNRPRQAHGTKQAQGVNMQRARAHFAGLYTAMASSSSDTSTQLSLASPVRPGGLGGGGLRREAWEGAWERCPSSGPACA
jgi:hypothetical protein